MNFPTKLNLYVGIANIILAFYLLSLGEFPFAVVCGASAAYNVAIFKEWR